MDKESGPGLRLFWELLEQGQQPDLAELARRYPDEMVTLAEAARAAQRRSTARTRERLWAVRDRLLVERGETVTLGASLKQKRLALGLSEEALARRLSARGIPITSDAVRSLEEGVASPIAVRTPETWAALASVLGIDAARLMPLLERAARQRRTPQQFTRMARGATSEEREAFLEAASTAGSREGDRAERYLLEVRTALGLPPGGADPTQ